MRVLISHLFPAIPEQRPELRETLYLPVAGRFDERGAIRACTPTVMVLMRVDG
jgi:hypothetical protein